MMDKVILWGRAVGIVIATVPAFCVAVAVQFVLIQWRTASVVWGGRVDTRSPQQVIADREEAKKARTREEANKRQLKHIRQMRTEGGIVGAIIEVGDALAERIRGDANDADDEGESDDELDEDG